MKMNARKKIIIAALLVAIIILPAQAEEKTLNIYLDNNKVPIRTLTSNGEIYLSLSDLGKFFSEIFILDFSNARLDIYSAKKEEIKPAISKIPSSGSIYGKILIKDKSGMEFPASGVQVALFVLNPDIPDNITLDSFKRWAKGLDSEFLETNGKVRETVTDASGNFYLEPCPPGNYQITAIYCTTGGKSGVFWRKKITIKKDEPVVVNFNIENAYDLN